MANIDLTATVGNVLKLREPFWVASSHFTENEAILRRWIEFEPAALTLKTCTLADRAGEKRSVRRKTFDTLPRYGRSYYSDGPKSAELHSYDQSANLLKLAKELLTTSKIGVSVLAATNENFSEVRDKFAAADFFELNLKYSMRISDADGSFFDRSRQKWKRTLEIICAALSKLGDKAVFVKIPRELSWLPGTCECDELLKLLAGHGKAGLIVANSLKIDIAEFVHNSQETELLGGVLMGDALYDGTIALIEGFRSKCKEFGIPIVASGGMVDEQQVLMAFRAGADAVQLCTSFEYNKLGFYRSLGSAIAARIRWRGLKNFADFLQRIRVEGIASIYSMPFTYYSTFWSEDLQKEIKLDIRSSERLDAVVMSGSTLLEKWEGPIKARIKAHRSTQLFLPNPKGEIFLAIQRSWGIVEANQLAARQARAEDTRKKMETWFSEEQPKLLNSEPRDVEWGVYYYDQCPFYSFYIFDDKVYLAQYPFMRPDRLGSPVYVFFRSSPEYDRLDRELHAMKAAIAQTTEPTVAQAPIAE